MQRVHNGSISLKSRRDGALARLEKHLADHRGFHRDESTNKYALDDAKFKTHDEKQKKELAILKERVA
jgi:hypothetical protein